MWAVGRFFRYNNTVLSFRNMSCFTQVLNPITGQSEWKSQCENYDYHQEVARSAFADMLHDVERNQKYYAALKKCIQKIHENGQEAHVLDIGTGTGILAMMAVKSGADSVIACEAFLPMANCAEKIIKANGMTDKIQLIKKRSTDITLGESGDMKRRANVLVTEVFDTELIGESAIEIFNHAHEHLLTDDCVVIPNSSKVYIQIVESPLAACWSKPKLLANLDGELLLKTPPEIEHCQGECAVHDIQLSQLDIHQFNPLLNPVDIFDFDWSSKQPIEKCRSKNIKLKANKHGALQVVFFWWDLKMDKEGEILLSCAPYWAHPDFSKMSLENNCKKPIQNSIPWLDHWMQALYYLPKHMIVDKDQEFYLNANHDEYSFWFDVSTTCQPEKKIERFACSCGFHLAYSRSRIGQLNNNLRNKKYLRIIEEIITGASNVLSMSDGSLIGLSTSALGAKSVTCLESHTLSRNAMELYVKHNELQNVNIIKNINEAENVEQITHIIAEPYYITSILPWDNLYFGTLLSKIKQRLKNDVSIMPVGGKIYSLPVEFVDLHKIRSPLGECEGFDLSVFDRFIEISSQLADASVEAQPLWEYPCVALSRPQEMLEIDFRNFEEKKKEAGSTRIECDGHCNGIALWIDWTLDGSKSYNSTISTGPQIPVEVGDYVRWDMFTRQGVHLFSYPQEVSDKNSIKWEISFVPNEGDLRFHFDII